MSDLETTVAKLCQASRESYLNPFELLEWPEHLDREQWFTSPELISLYGTEAWNRLSETERKRLSFFEAVNFFSLNIHGEKPLVEGLARRLYQPGNDTVSPYLHHFLDEENKHMVYFGGFCTRYAGKIYADRKLAFPREYAEGEEDFLFFAKVLIFEEIVDVYNVRMWKDQRLVPIVRQINGVHHQEETRHLAFGRRLVQWMFGQRRHEWSPGVLAGVREYLSGYLRATWKEYYNPDVYRDAGFEDPYRVLELAYADPASKARREEVSQKCVRYLLEHDILEKAPEL